MQELQILRSMVGVKPSPWHRTYDSLKTHYAHVTKNKYLLTGAIVNSLLHWDFPSKNKQNEKRQKITKKTKILRYDRSVPDKHTHTSSPKCAFGKKTHGIVCLFYFSFFLLDFWATVCKVWECAYLLLFELFQLFCWSQRSRNAYGYIDTFSTRCFVEAAQCI